MFKNRINKATKASKQPVFKQDYFNDCHRTYSCIHCRAHLANHDELISKLFQGNHGRAYLFNKVVNIGCKQAVQRELLTGLHAVADIYCDSCETTLGWKYEQAFVPSQKYKEGKYIIELVHMLKENNWDPTSYNDGELLDEAKISRELLEENEFKVGNISRYNRNDVNDLGVSDRGPCFTSLNLGRDAGENVTRAESKINSNQSVVIEIQIPPSQFIADQTNDNNENAPHVETDLTPSNMKLMERSLDKLELVATPDNHYDNPQNLLTNDSLCSSQSQSDLSLSVSVVDSGAGDDSSYELATSPAILHDSCGSQGKTHSDSKELKQPIRGNEVDYV